MRGDVQIALLRGINVGGKSLPMSDLVSIFREAGCSEVRTYIQSGNVLFVAGPSLAPRVPSLIRKAIASRFGFDVPVVTRGAGDLSRVVRGNPFLKRGTDIKMLHVAFLEDRPSRQSIASLEPDRSPPDEFVVRGREIYLRLPNGAGRSKLTTQYFESRLQTKSTVRNWNTLLALLERAGIG